MIIYVLDDLFRSTVVDDYISAIWTERYDSTGDIELVLPYSQSKENLLSVGTYLSIDESRRLMEIKTCTKSESESGEHTLKVVGEDAVGFYKDRSIVNLFSKSNKVRFTGTPYEIAKDIAIKCYRGYEEVFRTNLLYGPKLTMEGYTAYKSNCTATQSNNQITITPTSSSWHIRSDVGNTTGMAEVPTAGQSYLINLKASRPVQVVICMNTPGTTNNETDYGPDGNGIYNIPEDVGTFRFFRIKPAESDSSLTSIVLSAMTMEKYEGYKYDTPFNGSTAASGGVSYAWSGTAWQSTSTATGIVWVLPNSELGFNITFDDEYVNSGTIPYPDKEITVEFNAGEAYSIIKNICTTYGMGFGMTYYWFDYGFSVYFGVYMGTDRTTSQTAVTPVVFSKSLDSLTGITELTSLSNYKNVAIVTSPAGVKVVYAGTASPDSTGGRDLKILHVSVDSLTDIDNVDAYLLQKGLDELSKHLPVYALDGELSKNSKYVYDKDYKLGDIVEMQSDGNLSSRMRVEEQTFIQDSEGFRSYPTLVVDQVVTPGSWTSGSGNKYWIHAEGYWSEAE